MSTKNDPTTESSEREFVMERIFDAPRELVFQAFSACERVARWWGPDGFQSEVDPEDPQARTDLGAVYFAVGNHDGAEGQFKEALRLRPDYPPTLLGQANLYLRAGQEDDAIPLLQRAAKAAPKAFEPRFLLGSAYNRLGRYQEALAELQSALRLGANEPEVFYHLARAYGGLDRPEDRREALARFGELSRKVKADTDAQRRAMRLVSQAKILVDSGDLRGARAALEQAREAFPADDRILYRLAGLNYDLGSYDLARNYAEEAVSLAPSVWLYHYLLGLTELHSGRLQQALSSLGVAVKLNPSAAEVHNALGQVALKQNDLKRAIESFRRATELDPQQPAYRLNLEAASREATRLGGR